MADVQRDQNDVAENLPHATTPEALRATTMNSAMPYDAVGNI
jgi:hypothetical protein